MKPLVLWRRMLRDKYKTMKDPSHLTSCSREKTNFQMFLCPCWNDSDSFAFNYFERIDKHIGTLLHLNFNIIPSILIWVLRRHKITKPFYFGLSITFISYRNRSTLRLKLSICSTIYPGTMDNLRHWVEKFFWSMIKVSHSLWHICLFWEKHSLMR